MRNGGALFTPQSLLGSPRRSAGTPNASGTTVLFTTSTYSFGEHSQTTTLQALLVQTGETITIAANQDISHINWLDDERFVCLRPEKDGRTSLLYARFNSALENNLTSIALRSAGIINATASCLKAVRINRDLDAFAVVVSAPVCENGRLYAPADAAQKPNSSGRLYDSLFVRHWDRYEGPERNSLWYGKLSPTDGRRRGEEGGGQYRLSDLTNLLAGTNAECPPPPFGGSDTFDVRRDAVIWLAKDPGINPAWNTKCNVYVRRIDSWDPLEEGFHTNAEIRQIDVAGFDGVAASPVFAPVGNKAAFLMMRKNRYEADKNQIFVVPDITASRLEVVRAFGSAEHSPLEGTWDLSPSSVCFAADGESLIVVAEDQGLGRVFFVRGEDITTGAGVPRPLTRSGTAVDVRCLVDGHIFVSGSSMVDDSWYMMTEDPTKTAEAKPGIPPTEPTWFHSNSDKGERHGLHRSQISSIWTPASNPAITENIHSWAIKPSTFDKTKKYPVAYLIHGGPHAAWKDAWSTRWSPTVFAEQGYIVIAPNISGSTGYGQAFTDSSFRNWGGDPYCDLVNVFEWVGGNLEGADNDRAVALGNSYGGYMASELHQRSFFLLPEDFADAFLDQLDPRPRARPEAQSAGLPRRHLQLGRHVVHRRASLPLLRDGRSALAAGVRRNGFASTTRESHSLRYPASMGSERAFEPVEDS
jgi:dipeptidyl aminopeptidase/acylaminoacyl peptidase